MKKTLLWAAVLTMTALAGHSAERPEYIRTDLNVIELPANANRDNWHKVARDLDKLKETGKHLDIVHIGDSHIQAEMGTSRLRELLQQRYGNAGRGLITAFRLAGTNQPVDYAITSENPTDSQARLLKRPWPIQPGFTGVASSSQWSNNITFKNLGEGHRFNRARIFTSAGEYPMRWETPRDSASFLAFGGERVYGVYTDNSTEPGVVYSTIGNNGACFSDYLLIDGFSEDVARFNPRIIILSMGTNEGFSSMTDDEIASTTRELIHRLRTANPDAVFMLWTPQECQKKDDGGNFHINPRVADARNIMLGVARDEGLAVWDFYAVAGGDGSSDKWLGDNLMNPRDHVHLLRAGYQLQGDLAAEAIIDFLDSLR